jgi:hypothetical protein
MQAESMSSDYKIDSGGHRVGASIAGSAPGGASSGVEDFLHLLARAVKQFHTYPPTSLLCTEALAACLKSLAALDRPDRLVVRVTPTALIADDVPIGRGTIIEQEIVRRLHRSRVAELDIDRAASARDLAHFCTDLIGCDDLVRTRTTLAERLTEHGVDTFVPRAAHRPEVLNVGARPAPLWNLVAHDRARRDAAATGGPPTYLYPPDKGWVRLETGSSVETVSLLDLAVLVDDPGDIASMLLRLTDDEPPGEITRADALEQKFSDVATLFAALDGHLANVMFGKLARAVLAIEPDRRKTLLRQTILPGLLDGRADGAVLRGFPDADLAESLCLLLELETAAPEVVAAALNRLDLPAERRQAVVSLVAGRLQAGEATSTPDPDRERERGIDRFARRLVRVESTPGKRFGDFSAFDLSMDEQAAVGVARVREGVAETDGILAQIDCLRRLIRLEPNPTVVEGFLRRALTFFDDLYRAERWHDLAAAALRYRELADQLTATRPDVADAMDQAFGAFCTPGRVRAFFDLHERGADDPDKATRLIEAFGAWVAPGLAALLDDPSMQAHTRALAPLLCAHAGRLAPGLVRRLGQCGPGAARVIVRVCGFAGPGHEAVVAEQLASGDELTVREALRALARIGTARAATLVGLQIQHGSPLARAAAEETLWHFPPGQVALQVRELLGLRDFVLQNPQAAGRIIDRAAQTGARGLEGVLGDLEALRFHFWNPGIVRVALKAREHRDR